MLAHLATWDADTLRLTLPGPAQVAVPWAEVEALEPCTEADAPGATCATGLRFVWQTKNWRVRAVGPLRAPALVEAWQAARAAAGLMRPPPAPRHTLVLAGPGTGKTTALVEEAARLLDGGTRTPETVLLLAFTRAAADHLRLRLAERLGEAAKRVVVRTFHALAADIAAEAEGRRMQIAPWTADPQAVRERLEAELSRRMERDARFRGDMLAFFAWHLHPAREALDFGSWDDLKAHLRTLDLRTLAGERVRSRGEWIVANWLFLHGIPYHYERPIPPEMLGQGDAAHGDAGDPTRYIPDFFLPDHGVYIEHLGLDRMGRPPSFMDPSRYLAQLEWKRAWHARQPTKLVETFAFESADGSLPQRLALRLAHAGVKAAPLPWEDLRAKLDARHTTSRFAALAELFLRRLGAAGETVASCRAQARAGRWREREMAFLDGVEPLADAHRTALAQGDADDFDGLIARATRATQTKAWRNPFAHVLVDEAQDLSPARTTFLAALVKNNARLFAVGDDRQAVFRFAGADPGVLRNFKRWFGLHEKRELRRTFRLNAALAQAAERFVSRDGRHARAPMVAAREGPPDPVRALFSKHPRDGAKEALRRIAARHPGASVLLLARYGATARALGLEGLRLAFPMLTLDAHTVHAAKGREADFAIVLDLAEGRFPAVAREDPLLALAGGADPWPGAEERRLFFVALTRAREAVWLVVDPDKPSPFVGEVAPQRLAPKIALPCNPSSLPPSLSPTSAKARCATCTTA